MKLLTRVLLFASLVLAMTTANATNCDRIFAKQDLPPGLDFETEKANLLREVIVTVDGVEMASSYRLGQETRDGVKAKCPERFSFMTSNTSAIGYIGFVLRNMGILDNGVEVPAYLPVEMIVERLDGEGFGTFLPLSRKTTAATKEEFQVPLVVAELSAMGFELERAAEKPLTRGMVNDMSSRLAEFAMLPPVDSAHEATVTKLEGIANTLSKGLEEMKQGQLTEARLQVIIKEANSKWEGLPSRVESLESAVATQGFQIQSLALGVAALCILMVISGVVRDRRTKAIEVRTSALEMDSKSHSSALNGDGTKGNRGLIAESARQTAIISRLEARMDGIVGFLDKDMDVSLNEIEGREGNLDNNKLANLPLGSDNATVWRFTVRGKPGSIYQPLLWRTRETPDGFLCIGLSKSLNGEPCCEAKVNIENLRLEIASLVSKGLIDPDPVLSNKPALSMVSKA